MATLAGREHQAVTAQKRVEAVSAGFVINVYLF